MIEGFSDQALLMLGALVFTAGFIDSIAGGGGLITLPAYLNAGVKENLLLGTNKASSTFGTLMAAARYFRTLNVGRRRVFFLALTAMAGSVLGAKTVSLLPSYFIRYLLLIFN